MANKLMGSIRDLLMMDSEPPLDFDYRRKGRRYPREHPEAEHECIDPCKRHVTDAPNEDNSPLVHVDTGREGKLGFPNPRRKWLKAWQQENTSARL
jgi:hypothetical protein